jgi:hypothetical protein
MPSWPVVAPVNDLTVWLSESVPRQLSLVESDDHLSGERLSIDTIGQKP